jgi:tetratricopeptide (TPR) repeat protein
MLTAALSCLFFTGGMTAQNPTEAKTSPPPMQHHATAASGAPKPATLVTGVGNAHHPVSTKNPQAQAFFDQGLRYVYAFNHDEAARSFRRAAELDPKLAMAYWGVAEAIGPNYNDPAGEERFKAAHEAIQKAMDLSAGAPHAEQAYIHAMALRFPADPQADRKKAAEDYRDAMRKLMQDYPDDLDAATLFAESAMNLRPWQLWNHDGTPAPGTEEIVATLESVVRRNPNAVGAVHYYIHAVEASNNPDRALAGANRLAALAPSAGHLVHMPAHIYIRTGDFEQGVKTNQLAAAADRAYMKGGGAPGIYTMMYYSHNLHFIASCASSTGNYAEAKRNADLLSAHVAPAVKDVPPLEAFMTVPIAVDVRFHRWDDILKMPAPGESFKTLTVFWHYARGLALAGTGKVSDAEREYKMVAEAEKQTPPDLVFAMPINNKTKDILKIAENYLGAKIALAKKDPAAVIGMLQEAVRIQDTLNYDEPPDWFFPVRESLGAAMLMNSDAAGAEKVFRADLQKNPRNPRSLFGLQEALKAQGREYDAGYVEQEFKASWKGVAGLKVEDLV